MSYFGAEVYNHSYPIETWKTCFTPSQKCQALILHNISEATHSIKVMAYSFTDPDIIKALIKARLKGLTVELILDNSNIRNKFLQPMIDAKLKVRIDKPQGIAHNKVIIIDDRIVITGSYNYSKAAYKRNAENLLIINDAKIAKEYLHNWQTRFSKSFPTPLKPE